MDTELFQNIDSIDNGVSASPTIFDYITSFLPSWDDDNSMEKYNNCFEEVLEITISILKKTLNQYVQKAIADNYIYSTYQNSIGNLLEIPSQTFPWLDAILEINIQNTRTIDFVIFEYPAGGWAAQCVPPSKAKQFEKRISFPKKWAGQTNDLEKISSVSGAFFCHNNLFFIRAKTKEAIVKMCYIATKCNKT